MAEKVEHYHHSGSPDKLLDVRLQLCHSQPSIQDRSWREGFKFRLARWLALYCSRLTQIDSGNLHRKLSHRIRSCNRMQSQKNNSNSEANSTHMSTALWPQLVFVIYVYMIVRLSASVFWTVNTHSCELKMESIMGQLNSKLKTNDTLASSEIQLLQNELNSINESLVASLEIQHRLGDPYGNFGMSAAAGYAILINLALLSYVTPIVYYNYCIEFRSFILDLLYDEQTEQINCREMIDRELKRIEKSSWNATVRLVEIAMGNIPHTTHRLQTGRFPHPSHDTLQDGNETLRILASNSAIVAALKKHSQVVMHLNRLGSSDILTPMNRKSRLMERTVNQFLSINIINFIYSFFLDIFLAFLVPQFLGVPFRLEANDIEMWAVILTLSEMNVITTGFSLSIMNVHTSDQLEYVKHLSLEFRHCIRDNQVEFRSMIDKLATQPISSHQESIDLHTSKINENLHEIWLKYRIFIRQLQQFEPAWGIWLIGAFDVILGLPFLLAIFSPYLETNKRSFGLAFTITVLFYGDSTIIPLCKLHIGGDVLHKALWSLLASTMEMDLVARELLGGPFAVETVYEQLIKELSHPEALLSQVQVNLLGLKATYSNMIKYHFYYGVIAMSLFFEVESWRSLLGDRLQDPLNLKG